MEILITNGYDILCFLFFVGMTAGFIDSIAGGGGLISLPALLSVGIPPHIALGTNKLQGTFGALTSAFNYIRNGKVNLKSSVFGIVITLIGAATGASLIQKIDPSLLNRLVPVLLLLVLIYTIFYKSDEINERQPKMQQWLFFLIFGFSLGFYDGFFGPGTGSFWTAALMLLMGYNMTQSVGITRVMNFTSNVVALSLFVVRGNVYFTEGLVMAAGQIIGARIGSSLAIKKGTRFIRPIFIVVVSATIIRLIYLNYFVK